jgi:hypothetical protein
MLRQPEESDRRFQSCPVHETHRDIPTELLSGFSIGRRCVNRPIEESCRAS